MIETLHKGLRNKTAKLKVLDRETGAVGFVAVEVNAECEDYDVDSVSVLDIMHLYKLDRIDVFKIDIEGSEYYLFDDNCTFWADKVGMFIIELHERIVSGCEEQVINKLVSHGFQYNIMGENYVFTRCN